MCKYNVFSKLWKWAIAITDHCDIIMKWWYHNANVKMRLYSMLNASWEKPQHRYLPDCWRCCKKPAAASVALDSIPLWFHLASPTPSPGLRTVADMAIVADLTTTGRQHESVQADLMMAHVVRFSTMLSRRIGRSTFAILCWFLIVLNS